MLPRAPAAEDDDNDDDNHDIDDNDDNDVQDDDDDDNDHEYDASDHASLKRRSFGFHVVLSEDAQPSSRHVLVGARFAYGVWHPGCDKETLVSSNYKRKSSSQFQFADTSAK